MPLETICHHSEFIAQAVGLVKNTGLVLKTLSLHLGSAIYRLSTMSKFIHSSFGVITLTPRAAAGIKRDKVVFVQFLVHSKS